MHHILNVKEAKWCLFVGVPRLITTSPFLAMVDFGFLIAQKCPTLLFLCSASAKT